jgi:hypothetical protein
MIATALVTLLLASGSSPYPDVELKSLWVDDTGG